MTDQTPCRDPQNDPEDWFIDKDGKQYPDDDFVTTQQVNDAADAIPGFDKDDLDQWETLVETLEEDAKKTALRKRRHARDKCYTECYFRTHCAQAALDTRPEHGTWGGYYREELKVLYKDLDARKRRQAERRAAAQAAAEAKAALENA